MEIGPRAGSTMDSEQHDNLTTNDYPHYTTFSNETTESIESMYDLTTNRLEICQGSRKILPTFVEFINASFLPYPDEWKEPSYAAEIRKSVFATIIVVGIIGNLGVILTIALNRSMRTTVNVYIANLAFADVMTCIFAGPAFYDVLGNDYFFGLIPCKFFGFAMYTCLECSVLTLSAISFDRFMAVFYPLHVRVTKQRKPLVVTIIWLLSMLVGVPHIIINKIQTIQFKDGLDRTCKADWSNQRYHHEKYGHCNVKSAFYIFHSILQTVFLYLLPILIMITAYSFIFWRLWRTKVPGEQIASNDKINSTRQRRAHRMIFAVLIVFAICWTPYQIAILFEITFLFDRDFPEWWPNFRWAAWFFYLGNSCMNPVIYAGFKQDFRLVIRAVLRCCNPVLTTKQPQNKRNALDGADKIKPLEMKTKCPGADEDKSSGSNSTTVAIEDTKETKASS